MSTQQNMAAVPRREARGGGALDAETALQVTELNQRTIAAVRELLGAGSGGSDAGPGPAERAAASTSGGALREAAAGLPPSARRRRKSGETAAQRPATRRLAASGRGSACPPRVFVAPPGLEGLPSALHQLHAGWLGLDVAAREVLATSPYLLVAVDVARLLAVAGVPASQVLDSPADAARAADGLAGSAPWRDLSRMVVQYAWHLSRAAPTLAGFVLGAKPAAIESLRTLGVARADALARLAAPAVRLRWDDDVAFWSAWLAAAAAGDAAAIWSCRLQGLQRIAGECRPPWS